MNDDKREQSTAHSAGQSLCQQSKKCGAVKGKHRDGILHKGLRGRSLRQSQKRFNKRISKQHFRVEGCFGTMRRLFGLQRARYFDVTKTHAQMVLAAIGQNLLKAVNKITFNKQTPVIA